MGRWMSNRWTKSLKFCCETVRVKCFYYHARKTLKNQEKYKKISFFICSCTSRTAPSIFMLCLIRRGPKVRKCLFRVSMLIEHLLGFKAPKNLKLSAHFDGTCNISPSVLENGPLYYGVLEGNPTHKNQFCTVSTSHVTGGDRIRTFLLPVCKDSIVKAPTMFKRLQFRPMRMSKPPVEIGNARSINDRQFRSVTSSNALNRLSAIMPSMKKRLKL
jgi:hypothetical protein